MHMNRFIALLFVLAAGVAPDSVSDAQNISYGFQCLVGLCASNSLRGNTMIGLVDRVNQFDMSLGFTFRPMGDSLSGQ
jgi:hypothetical protein